MNRLIAYRGGFMKKVSFYVLSTVLAGSLAFAEGTTATPTPAPEAATAPAPEAAAAPVKHGKKVEGKAKMKASGVKKMKKSKKDKAAAEAPAEQPATK